MYRIFRDVISVRNFSLHQMTSPSVWNKLWWRHFLLQDTELLQVEESVKQGTTFTGFQLIDRERVEVKQFYNGWKDLDPNSWPGAGQTSIRVRTVCLFCSVSLCLFCQPICSVNQSVCSFSQSDCSVISLFCQPVCLLCQSASLSVLSTCLFCQLVWQFCHPHNTTW